MTCYCGHDREDHEVQGEVGSCLVGVLDGAECSCEAFAFDPGAEEQTDSWLKINWRGP
jgi:hypothetical protein